MNWAALVERWRTEGPNMGPIGRGYRLGGGFHMRCTDPACDGVWAHTYTVCDHPLTEETRCATCDRVLDVNGQPVPLPEQAAMAGDGQGRR